ncbi:MAG: GDSL-type esterase/lipase family protein [Terricaulis sp.]
MKYFLAACLIFIASACASSSYNTLGRYMAAPDGGATFAWPGSGVEGHFRGTRVIARIEDGGDSIMDLAIDGVITQLPLDPGVRDYTLFEAANAEEHDIRLTRRSEVFSGLTTIHAVTLDGAWLPTTAHAHRILFLGDSITVGYGAAGADQTCRYSAEASPPFDAYSHLTAGAFDADVHVLAISGRGVVRNYDGEAATHMPALLDTALPDHPEFVWDHARFAPELIVINLGANDFSTTGPGDAFEPAYVALLGAVRDRYPNAHIISAFGPEDKRVAIDAITRAVGAFNQTQNRPVTFLYLPNATSGHIYGCDWHPGIDAHKVMARALAAQIEHDLGWTYRAIE